MNLPAKGFGRPNILPSLILSLSSSLHQILSPSLYGSFRYPYHLPQVQPLTFVQNRSLRRPGLHQRFLEYLVP